MARVVRLLRLHTELTQDAIANLTGLSQGMVSQLESRKRSLRNPDKQRRALEGLGAPRSASPMATAGGGKGSKEEAVSWDSDTEQPDARYWQSLSHRVSLDSEAAEEARAGSRHIIGLDSRLGGGDLVPLAARAARMASQVALSSTGRVSKDFLSAVAEAQQVAGWIAYDADQQSLTRQFTLEALHTSRLAGDTSTERMVLSQLAMQDVHLHQPAEAVQISEAALEATPTPRMRALFTLRLARAVAQCGERARALRLIDQTRSLHQDGVSDRDPAWAWWLDGAEITWHHAMIHADLDEWKKAVPLLVDAAEGRPCGYDRGRFNDYAHLLYALVKVRAWQEAEHVAQNRLLPCLEAVCSPRTMALLAQTAGLAAHLEAPLSLREAIEQLGGITA